MSESEAKRTAPGEKLTRRSFLERIIQGGLLVIFGSMVLPALEYLWPITRSGPAVGLKEVAREDEIPVWGSKKVVVGGSAILLFRTATEFKAYSAVCTHLGCLVDWDGAKRQIVCPCHAGLFNTDGAVIEGPPPRALPGYAVKVNDGRVFIQI